MFPRALAVSLCGALAIACRTDQLTESAMTQVPAGPALSVGGTTTSLPNGATTTTLTFEGITHTACSPTSVSGEAFPDGASFSADWTAGESVEAGGCAQVRNEPSPPVSVFLSDGRISGSISFDPPIAAADFHWSADQPVTINTFDSHGVHLASGTHQATQGAGVLEHWRQGEAGMIDNFLARIEFRTQGRLALDDFRFTRDVNRDGDMWRDGMDNCPQVSNDEQSDVDQDGQGDPCDPDFDEGDGISNTIDNCPAHVNPDQSDIDHDGLGDLCDPDYDEGDGIPNGSDNCPQVYNPDQSDSDGDGEGDRCDPDLDRTPPTITISGWSPGEPVAGIPLRIVGHLEDPLWGGVSSGIDYLRTQIRIQHPDGDLDVGPIHATSEPVGWAFDYTPPVAGQYRLTVVAVDRAGNNSGDTYADIVVGGGPDGDGDGDGIPDDRDNCPAETNADQTNTDGDAAGDGCDEDDDNDGLTDTDEAQRRTDPLNPDSDADGLQDGEELALGSDPLRPDTDGDELTDGEEVRRYRTDPLTSDTDEDGVADGLEVATGTDPLNPLDHDDDRDGVTDAKDNCPSFANPRQEDFNADGRGDACSDVDGDGLTDAEELQSYGTKPKTSDTDADGLTDGDEVKRYGTKPTIPDTDMDKLVDGEEIHRYRTDPLKGDTDGDGVSDGDEVAAGTDPLVVDTDADGIPDMRDNCAKTANTEQQDFNGDGKGDACSDVDVDGLTDAAELKSHGTNPTLPDTDGDGVSDGDEIVAGTDPLRPPVPPYSFTGFLQPVDNNGIYNVVKAGSAIPVKFRLGGYQTLDIFRPADAQGPYPQVHFSTCGTSTDPIEQTVTASTSALAYDSTTDTYTYVWKTEKGWAGKCGTFRLGLDDGSAHSAFFKFTK